LRRPVILLALAMAIAPFALGAGCQGGNSSGPISAASASATPSAAATPPITFDATRAYADLKTQVAFGPRIPQTKGHDDTRDWILAQLKDAGVTGARQDFNWDLGGGTKLAMTNITAQINPSAKKQVMLCAHWDSRPTADQEVDPAKKKQPIPGADDGASGVAVLLELARKFVAQKPTIGVQIVFLDGEDYGPGEDRMYLGARYYATHPALPKPDYAILIDMIGDKDLDIYRELNSESIAPDINDKVWHAAEALGDTGFKYGTKYSIDDDHIPLIKAGWKAIDLIDFDYGSWHTLDDTPDKCSADSLKQVGDTLAKVIYDEK